MIDAIEGLRLGHVTHGAARTGCTVVLADQPVTASGEVRGSAPATREFSLLDPLATVQAVDAVTLSGGSAFGLAAGDGVMAWLDDNGRGFPTAWGRVPIVVGMSLFDLPVCDPTVRPTATDGYEAASRAAGSTTGGHPTAAPGALLGAIGAGTGATVSKWRGAEVMRDAGLVGSVQEADGVLVAALVAVNAWGDVLGTPEADLAEPQIPASEEGFGHSGNTTIGVVATNAVASKSTCMHMARGAHDGLARAISPPHASLDGDAFVALATGAVPAAQDQLRWMAVKAVSQAILAVGTDPARR